MKHHQDLKLVMKKKLEDELSASPQNPPRSISHDGSNRRSPSWQIRQDEINRRTPSRQTSQEENRRTPSQNKENRRTPSKNEHRRTPSRNKEENRRTPSKNNKESHSRTPSKNNKESHSRTPSRNQTPSKDRRTPSGEIKDIAQELLSKNTNSIDILTDMPINENKEREPFSTEPLLVPVETSSSLIESDDLLKVTADVQDFCPSPTQININDSGGKLFSSLAPERSTDFD